ncbi:hypothetical protein [Saccharothrix sp.]|nr:hypothetical protein [Saccharothrix sp.]
MSCIPPAAMQDTADDIGDDFISEHGEQNLPCDDEGNPRNGT